MTNIDRSPCDVGCQPHIHTGSHWLHMDRYWRDANHRLMALAVEARNTVLAEHVVQEELRRLAHKRHAMPRHGLWLNAEDETP